MNPEILNLTARFENITGAFDTMPDVLERVASEMFPAGISSLQTSLTYLIILIVFILIIWWWKR